jgi:hypothetical protein
MRAIRMGMNGRSLTPVKTRRRGGCSMASSAQWRETMFKIFERANDKQVIDNGRVYCRNRSCDTDIELCAGCRWLTEINMTGKVQYLRCESAPCVDYAQMLMKF